jgi:uncharacterized protein DUF6544
MLKYFFAFLLLAHGLLHFIGFARAFGYGAVTQLTKDISRPAGVIWLAALFLFLSAMFMFLRNNHSWVYIAGVAVILSQVVIINSWEDARFGSAVNLIVLMVAVAGWASDNFEGRYQSDVTAHLLTTAGGRSGVVTENDIQSLPVAVQEYMRYSGVVGKPKVSNMRIVFNGQMREKGKDWFTFTSVQYNFFDDPTRLFFMKAKMFGITLPGYHRYENSTATMQIKLFGLFNVVNEKGVEMNQAETVTVFNDMCLMAPATMIDKRITWTSINSLSAKATFINGVNRITAILYFNHEGQLINFTSDDRYAVSDMKRYRFSTPVKDYISINGRNVFSHAETIWHYPDGEFVYGKFTLKSVEYNVAQF